ncbi:MAG: 3-phosphoshikimate 1-carboxyvinyltransferase [Bacteroidota bacterium]
MSSAPTCTGKTDNKVKHTILPSARLQGSITVPGDKSISHRALMIGALADGISEVHGFLNAADPRSTRSCLEALGIPISQSGDHLQIHGRGLLGLQAPRRGLDAGNSGTTMRLLSGILAGQPFVSVLTGDDSLSTRPMKRIIEPLTGMGAHIESSPHGTAPLRIEGRFPLDPLEYVMPFPSAQVKSTVLLAGLFAEGETRVSEPAPTRDHTERMLNLKASSGTGNTVIRVLGGQRIKPREFVIPGDISSAAFLIVAALIVPGSEVLLRDIGLNPTRSRILDVLRSVGADMEISNVREFSGEPMGDVLVRSSLLHGNLALSGRAVAEMIDEIPILAVAGLFLDGKFELHDSSDLRNKESDRIAAMVSNLRHLGCAVEEYPDGFAFEGGKSLKGGEVKSFHDHRIAMAFGVAGLALPAGMVVHDAECVDISYPGFWETLSSLQRS